MRILILSKYEPDPLVGGIERCTLLLTDILVAAGHNVSMLALMRAADRPVPDWVDFFPTVNPGASVNIKYLQDYVNREKVDIIINQCGLDRDLAKLFLSPSGCRKVSVVHGNPDFNYSDYYRHIRLAPYPKRLLYPFVPLLRLRFRFKMNRYYNWLVSDSDRVVLLSERYVGVFPSLAPSIKLTVIPNFTNRFADKNNEQDKSKTILYVGRMEREQKSVGYLLKAFKLIVEQNPDWHLCLVGDGPDMGRYVTMAKEMDLPNVSFKGFQQSEPYYTISPILCLTSSFEGFPMVLIEAMAHRCVPVSFDSFLAATDIIDSGRTGVLVPPKDYIALANAVNYLIENPNELYDMANAAYQTVSMRFSPAPVGSMWLKMLDSLHN